MKRGILHSFKFLSLLVVLLCLGGTLQAQQINLNRDGLTQLSSQNLNDWNISFKNEIANLSVNKIKTSRRAFVRLSAAGYVKTGKPGYPELPSKREIIEIPLGATPKVRIKDFNVKEISLEDYSNGMKIIPAQPPMFKSSDFQDFVYNKEAYKIDEFNVSELVEIKTLGIMRGSRLALLSINPVRYNPLTNTIKVFEDIEFDIIMEGADLKATYDLKARTASTVFDQLRQKMVFNSRSKANFTKYPVKYVIIADRKFENALQDFISWKIQKGFNVITAYTDESGVGKTTTSIKGYIKGLYDAGTDKDPAPSYVLFVGDVEQIPAFEPKQTGETDRLYCEFTGDLFPEIYYGRFSVQTEEQCRAIVEKTLMYEKCNMPDKSYLNDVFMIAGVDKDKAPVYGNPSLRYGLENYFNKEHNLEVESYYYPESASKHEEILAAVSRGVSYSNYTAHCTPKGWGDPAFEVQDVDKLTNKDKYGLLVGNCCSSSEFAQDEAFSEKLTRTAQKGAWGYIGASNSSLWDEDFYWSVGLCEIGNGTPKYNESGLGLWDRLFHENGETFEKWYVTGGQMLFAGNLSVTASGSEYTKYYWDIYNMVGDPSTMVYLGIPEPITAVYEETINQSSNILEVKTEPYGYIGVSKGTTLYGAALADKDGFAVVPLKGLNDLGKVKVTITAQNKEPFVGELTVKIADGPYVVMEKYTIIDKDANNNGVVEFGETIKFDLDLKNYGNKEATGLKLELTSEDQFIDIKKSTIDFDNITPGTLASMKDLFEVKISELVPNNHEARLKMKITCDQQEWTSWLILHCKSVDFVTKPYVITEEIEGDGDGQPDNGEKIRLRISIDNQGEAAIDDVTAKLDLKETEFASISNPVYKIAHIGAKELVEVIFDLEIASKCPMGKAIDFKVTYSKGDISIEKEYFIKIGATIEDFETGDFSLMPWKNYGNKEWVIADGGPDGSKKYAYTKLVNSSTNSIMEVDFEAGRDDFISFDVKFSTEEDYDYLTFYVDNTLVRSWSGEMDWVHVKYPIKKGKHNFKWEFERDWAGGYGENAVGIDNIAFPVPKPTDGPLIKFLKAEVNLAGDTYVCQGKDFGINFKVKSLGTETASGLKIELKSDDSDLIPVVSEYTLGDLEVGESIEKSDELKFKLSKTYPNDKEIPAKIIVTDGTNSWEKVIIIKGKAIILDAGNFLKIDDAEGNKNRQLDPGETANITFSVVNNGEAGLKDVNLDALLSCDNLSVEILEKDARITSLVIGEEEKVTFKVKIGDDIKDFDELDFNLKVFNDNFEGDVPFKFIAGLNVEDFESQKISPYLWQKSGNKNWEIVAGGLGSSKYLAQAELDDANQMAVLELVGNFIEGKKMSFDFKADLDRDFASFEFRVDDILKGKWNSAKDWKKMKFRVPAGEHRLTFKLSSTDNKPTKPQIIQIDNIVLPIAQKVGVERIENCVTNVSIYPNPAKDHVNISYENKKQAEISILIYNSLGQLVKESAQGVKFVGEHELQFSLENMLPGAYQCVIKVGEVKIVQKLIVQ
ncbi:MAG: C25 family cysteine peptidase [Bacteroidales bacterium]